MRSNCTVDPPVSGRWRSSGSPLYWVIWRDDYDKQWVELGKVTGIPFWRDIGVFSIFIIYIFKGLAVHDDVFNFGYECLPKTNGDGSPEGNYTYTRLAVRAGRRAKNTKESEPIPRHLLCPYLDICSCVCREKYRKRERNGVQNDIYILYLNDFASSIYTSSLSRL